MRSRSPTTAIPTATRHQPLAGRHIVVTRPQQQSVLLSSMISAAGGIPVLFPLLTIHPVQEAERHILHDVLRQLAAGIFDWAVFVSPNAIEKTFDELHALGLRWPEADNVRVAVVGKGSERALTQRHVSPHKIISPSVRYDSEGLLALPELQAAQMQGRRVMIFRGNGGRDLIAQTLRERGASVGYVTCYRRSAPQGAAADTPMLQTLWQQGQLDAITLTSSEGLRHLHSLLGEAGRTLLESTPLFVPHARIAEEARRLGLSRIVATNAGDAGLLAGLIEYFDFAASHQDHPHPEC